MIDTFNQFVYVYLDKKYFFSRTAKANRGHVRQVFRQLLENRLFVKTENYEFNVQSVSFLGYILAKGQLQPDLAKALTGRLASALHSSASAKVPGLLPEIHL